MSLAIGILLIIVLVFIIWRFIKPYTIKYDHTLMLTGGIGTGKTLTAVKIAVNLLRRARLSWWFENKFQLKIINKFRKSYNKKLLKKNPKNKQPKEILIAKPKPQIYSNLPMNFKPHFWSKKSKREWTCKLDIEHLILTKEMAPNCIILIDELPQLVNQFNWDEQIVQKNINEMFTFFRHYYNGYLLITAQAVDDIVVQIRRKCNQAIWCKDFHRHLFGLFYSVSMCDMLLNDEITTTSSTFVDENTRKYYGLFPPKDTYDSRCYSERLKNIYDKLVKKQQRWNNLKTNEIMRITEYISPLDDNTTEQQKQAQAIKYRKVQNNERKQTRS